MVKKYNAQRYKKCKILKEFRAEYTSGQRTYPHNFVKDEIVVVPDYFASRWAKRGHLEILGDDEPTTRYGGPCNAAGIAQVERYEQDVLIDMVLR